MENQLVVFNLANENYGVDIAAVDGIVKMQSITNVPHAPSFVEGITNLRGEVLPVINLRKRYGLPPGEITKDTRIVNVVLVHDDDQRCTKVGMVVDAVSEVLRVSGEDIEPPSPIVTIVITAPTPMTIPKMVNTERSILRRNSLRASKIEFHNIIIRFRFFRLRQLRRQGTERFFGRTQPFPVRG